MNHMRNALLPFWIACTLAVTARSLGAQPRGTTPPPAAAMNDGPSHLIFPSQRLPLRFSHARHLALRRQIVDAKHPASHVPLDRTFVAGEPGKTLCGLLPPEPAGR